MKMVEEATVVCAECGLTGRLIRHKSNGTLMVYAAFADFEALCRKEVPNYIEACLHWVEAQQAAVQHLRLPTEH